MSIRSNLSLLALCCASGAFATTPLTAQRPETPTVTVMTFQSPDKGLGADAADRLRSKLTDDYSQKTLHTVPTVDIANFLESSGFNIEDPLPSNDEKTLANSVRADFYITGKITHLATGYRIEPRLVLARDASLAQPLPIQNSRKLDDAISDLSNSLRDVMKQLPGERQCVSLWRTKKFPNAINAANAANKEYPQATLSRLCAQNVYYDLYQRAATHADSLTYSDSALAVAAQILTLDSLSVQPLKLNVELFKFRGDSTHYRAALLKLVKADPNNAKLTEQIVNEFALMGPGHAQEAYPLVATLLERSPGDPQILRTALSVYALAKDWQKIAEVGTDLAKVDTAAADSTYFIRMGIAYDSLKDPAKAADVLAQGTAKFPTAGTLWYLYSKALGKAGQEQEARVALRTATKYDTTYRRQFNIQILLPTMQLVERSQYDSAYTAILQGVADGVDSSVAAKYALNYGQKLYQANTVTKSRPELQRAVKFLQLSNQLQPTVAAQFIQGAASFLIMSSAVTEANTAKSCPLAQAADEAYADALKNIPVGQKDTKFQSGATGMLEYLMRFRKAIDSQLKLFCK